MSELGQALKEAREEKGMTLDDIQDLTKIQKRYLMAIESGEYSRLPGNFYTRAFIKSYAEAVGIDPKELIAEHSRELPSLENEVEVVNTRSRTHAVEKHDSKVVNALPKIAVIVVLVIVLVGIWFLMQKMTSGEQSKANGSDKSVVIKNGSDIGNGKTHSADQKKSDKAPTEADKQNANDKSDNAMNQQITLESTSGKVSHFSLTGTTQFQIEISAKQGANSWIQATKSDSKGERLYYGLVSNGVSGQKDAMFQNDLSDIDTLYVVVGSVPNTIIKVNGKTLTLPDSGTVQNIYITHKK